jgi:ribonucleotide reductase alpha subunit
MHLAKQIIVTLYDANKQYLTHFVTTEHYYPSENQNNVEYLSQVYKLVPIQAAGNELKYTVNIRNLGDAEYVSLRVRSAIDHKYEFGGLMMNR